MWELVHGGRAGKINWTMWFLKPQDILSTEGVDCQQEVYSIWGDMWESLKVNKVQGSKIL